MSNPPRPRRLIDLCVSSYRRVHLRWRGIGNLPLLIFILYFRETANPLHRRGGRACVTLHRNHFAARPGWVLPLIRMYFFTDHAQ